MTEQMDIFSHQAIGLAIGLANGHAIGLANGHGLTGDERCVWLTISDHRGKDHAISVHGLSAILFIPERRLQIIVRRLVNEHLLPVASTSDNRQPGYYWPLGEREALEHYWSLRRRGVRILMRAHSFHKSPELERLLGQLKLSQDAADA